MIGIKTTEYTVFNNEQGQALKKKFLKEYGVDAISVEENEKMITITMSKIFELNDYLWV